MSITYSSIFSEYDFPKASFKFSGDTKGTIIDTLGHQEVSAEVKTVTKNKRNMPWKSRTKETGSGTLKLQLHMPYNLYVKMFAAEQTGYKDNVAVWGNFCLHDSFVYSVLCEDEDGNQKLQAYPNCMMTSGEATSVDANGEEVAQIEMEISYNPDSDGVGKYEYMLGDPEGDTYPGETVVTNWLEAFATSMVKTAASAS